MCFVVHRDFPSPLIAEEDIVCYKYLSIYSQEDGGVKYYYSPVQQFEYQVGEEYPEVRLFVEGECIDEGYHSYTEEIHEGDVNAKFIIPKGSFYYHNPSWREYVSSRIKFVGPI